MPTELSAPSLIVTTVVFLLIFLLFATWSDRLPDEDLLETPVSNYKIAPARAATAEFCEWWTPEILDHYEEIEKMATPSGHHPIEPFQNVIRPSIAQWDLNKQDHI
jgi:hypothetical protein